MWPSEIVHWKEMARAVILEAEANNLSEYIITVYCLDGIIWEWGKNNIKGFSYISHLVDSSGEICEILHFCPRNWEIQDLGIRAWIHYVGMTD